MTQEPSQRRSCGQIPRGLLFGFNAIIQGLTEFLPVSSSAHLILPAQLLGWQDQGPLIDVMAHFGSLFAVMIYFRKEVGEVLVGLTDLARTKLNKGSALALHLILATPPALIVGAGMHFSGIDEMIRSPLLIACTFIIFGIVLWLADLKGSDTRSIDTLTWKEAIGLGLAQTLALIPGTSRSGITMTAALAMGLTRAESAVHALGVAYRYVPFYGVPRCGGPWPSAMGSPLMSITAKR